MPLAPWLVPSKWGRLTPVTGLDRPDYARLLSSWVERRCNVSEVMTQGEAKVVDGGRDPRTRSRLRGSAKPPSYILRSQDVFDSLFAIQLFES